LTNARTTANVRGNGVSLHHCYIAALLGKKLADNKFNRKVS